MAKTTTDPSDLPLVGLLHEVLLPGEEHTFTAPAVDPVHAARYAPFVGRPVLAVTLTAPAEMPALVAQRFATRARLVSVDPASGALTLAGEARVRLTRGHGTEAPFYAACEPDAAAASTPAHAQLARSLEQLLALSAAGLLPSPEAPRLDAQVAPLLRSLVDPETLRGALTQAGTPARALDALVSSLQHEAPARRASDELEGLLRKLAGKRELPEALKRRLWAQVVEVERRLDVYDPNVPVEEGDDAARLTRALQQAGLPKAARELAKSRLKALKAMRGDASDYGTFVRHLELMAQLAWHPEPLPPVDLARVRAELDGAHAGLDAPKKRVLEYLAVRALGGSAANTVLCLAGPPGTGKTSIARAIASALGRKFVRVALGGVHDECELRGHRLSFHAASPGRILSGFAQAGSATPVVLLDEIDKLGTDSSRSPAAALLEVLDPEQQQHFTDNFLATAYDVSNALFVCTANDLGALKGPLRDRLEVIELEGYGVTEKCSIVRAHLWPRTVKKHGLREAPALDDATVTALVEGYTREPGVRQLERSLASVARERAARLVDAGLREGDAQPAPAAVSVEELRRVLGPARGASRAVPSVLPSGTAIGLSVGPDGGAPLLIEVARTSALGGSGKAARDRLTLTGRMGEVMRESVQTVLAHLRAHARAYELDEAALAGHWHVHAPDAAQPKDGPSAGLALLVAFVSALRGEPGPASCAFTGELSLYGRVLPVGGVRAKTLAAERAALGTVYLPEDNATEVPEGLTVRAAGVREAREVLEALGYLRAHRTLAGRPRATARDEREARPAARGRRA